MVFQIYAYFMYIWKETYQICKNMKWGGFSLLQKIYSHPVACKI